MKAAPLIAGGLLAAVVVWRRDRLPRVAVLGAAAVCAGLLVYASGLVHPPNLEATIRDLTGALGPYTYALVGALAFLETGAGVGLIVPGELAVILGGVSAGQSEISLAGLIAIVWACALAGDLTSFTLGRRLGAGFLARHGRRVGVTGQRLAQAEGFFAAHGGKTIVIGRFIGFVRPLSPFVAGASRMPPKRFIPYTAVASGLWAATFCALGFVFWRSLDRLLSVTKEGTLALAAVVVVAAGAIALYRRLRTKSAAPPAPTG